LETVKKEKGWTDRKMSEEETGIKQERRRK
jgi:hypothetical protein